MRLILIFREVATLATLATLKSTFLRQKFFTGSDSWTH